MDLDLILKEFYSIQISLRWIIFIGRNYFYSHTAENFRSEAKYHSDRKKGYSVGFIAYKNSRQYRTFCFENRIENSFIAYNSEIEDRTLNLEQN